MYRRDKYASASLDLGGKKEKKKESGTPFLLDQRRRHLEISRRLETKIARLPYCRDVTVGVSNFRVGAITTTRSRTLARDAMKFA